MAHYFHLWRNGIIGRTLPGGDTAPRFIYVYVPTPGNDECGKIVSNIVNANTQGLAGLVSQWAHVNILLKGALLGQFYRYLAHLVDAVGHLHSHYLAAVDKSLVMFSLAEDVNLLVLVVPVTADAFKDGGTVVQGMGHNIYVGFGQRYKLFLKKGVGWHWRVSFSR